MAAYDYRVHNAPQISVQTPDGLGSLANFLRNENARKEQLMREAQFEWTTGAQQREDERVKQQNIALNEAMLLGSGDLKNSFNITDKNLEAIKKTKEWQGMTPEAQTAFMDKVRTEVGKNPNRFFTKDQYQDALFNRLSNTSSSQEAIFNVLKDKVAAHYSPQNPEMVKLLMQELNSGGSGRGKTAPIVHPNDPGFNVEQAKAREDFINRRNVEKSRGWFNFLDIDIGNEDLTENKLMQILNLTSSRFDDSTALRALESIMDEDTIANGVKVRDIFNDDNLAKAYSGEPSNDPNVIAARKFFTTAEAIKARNAPTPASSGEDNTAALLHILNNSTPKPLTEAQRQQLWLGMLGVQPNTTSPTVNNTKTSDADFFNTSSEKPEEAPKPVADNKPVKSSPSALNLLLSSLPIAGTNPLISNPSLAVDAAKIMSDMSDSIADKTKDMKGLIPELFRGRIGGKDISVESAVNTLFGIEPVIAPAERLANVKKMDLERQLKALEGLTDAESVEMRNKIKAALQQRFKD